MSGCSAKMIRSGIFWMYCPCAFLRNRLTGRFELLIRFRDVHAITNPVRARDSGCRGYVSACLCWRALEVFKGDGAGTYHNYKGMQICEHQHADPVDLHAFVVVIRAGPVT